MISAAVLVAFVLQAPVDDAPPRPSALGKVPAAAAKKPAAKKAHAAARPQRAERLSPRQQRYRAYQAELRRQQDQAYRAQLDSEAAWRAAAPLLLEQERIRLQAMNDAERNAALQRIAAGNERIAAEIRLQSVARQNAMMGYTTPALTTAAPGAVPYGPYGGIAVPAQPPQQLGPPTPFDDIIPR